MGIAKTHSGVKLFYAILFNDESTLFKAKEKLILSHGDIDLESPVFRFDYTSYYEREMGKEIKRIFYCFKNLIKPDELADIKIRSNEAELSFSDENRQRTINLDPGYMTLAKIVLASAKDNIQRIYIKNGIYEEITLYYKNDTFNAFDWTFPDYRESYIPFFNSMRNRCKSQLKNGGMN